jgi:type II secretory pathway pseudopilin PulG
MRAAGFALVESVVAAAILMTAIAGIAHLFVQSARTTARGRRAPVVLAAAQAKIEQLLGLAWGYDAAGAPRSDTTSDTSVEPPRPTGGTGLSPSPAESLSLSIPGFVDYVSGAGRPLGATPTTDTVFVRRWRISPLASALSDGLVLRVCVWRFARASTGGSEPEVCLGTARIRR